MLHSRRLLMAGLLLILLGGVGYGYVVIGRVVEHLGIATLAATPLPDLHENPSQSTKIYDRQGNLLYELGSMRKQVVALKDVPLPVKNAFLAAEDKSFYQNPGISLRSIFRAANADVRQDQLLQGGSTITQQLAQKLVVTKKSSVSRKLREIVVAMVLTKKYSKDTILERYLNEVPVGGDLVGIGTAAQVYFGVPVSRLTLAQGAYIAALINAPSILDPYLNQPGLTSRQQLVLQRMATFGFITKLQSDAAIQLVALRDHYAPGWIKLVLLAQNAGAASARNAGWERAALACRTARRFADGGGRGFQPHQRG